MSWNNIRPGWSIGNPFGPVPSDGKFYYFKKDRKELEFGWENDKRVGPFDTKAEAQAHKDKYNL